jgi:hypothetical protein
VDAVSRGVRKAFLTLVVATLAVLMFLILSSPIVQPV